MKKSHRGSPIYQKVQPLCKGSPRKKGSMKDHNFIPFNINTVSDVLARHAGTHWNSENECWTCFDPGIEQGFLDSKEIDSRSQKPGFWARAKFVLPTGCIQEVHVAHGESALEAFQRWHNAARACINAHRYHGTTLADFLYKCNLCKDDFPCKEDAKLMALAGELY
jgi:hypothetical protein